MATGPYAGTMLILAAVLEVSSCEDDRPAAPPASTPAGEQVEIRLTCSTCDPDVPCAFRPADVTIRVGGTVRWINDDATYHTVTSSERAEVRRPSGRFDGAVDAPGEAFSIRFTEAGTYPYYCQPHAEFMAGIVRVVRE